MANVWHGAWRLRRVGNKGWWRVDEVFGKRVEGVKLRMQSLRAFSRPCVTDMLALNACISPVPPQPPPLLSDGIVYVPAV